MNQFDLQDLLAFAEANGLQDKLFMEVYDLWKKEIADILIDYTSEETLAAIRTEEEYLAAI